LYEKGDVRFSYLRYFLFAAPRGDKRARKQIDSEKAKQMTQQIVNSKYKYFSLL
jgi:hypothetical protein